MQGSMGEIICKYRQIRKMTLKIKQLREEKGMTLQTMAEKLYVEKRQ